MSSFTVVLDACVLYPAPIRDLLLQLAVTDLFRGKWTEEIHEEWISNLLKQRPELSRMKLEHTKTLMNAHARDCMVVGYEHLTERIEGLPDPKDRHVVAAAYHCGAAAIVTFNLRDFPEEALARYGLEAIHPDDFVTYQMDLDPAKTVGAVHAVRSRLKNPRISADDYLRRIEALAMPKTAALLRPYAPIL